MKISLVCLLLVVTAAQARDWYKVRPIQRTVTPRADAPQRTGRIIGGDYATLGQFPYQIGLFADDSRFCGGSLISADTVLTAAHCSQGARSHEVHAGALNIYEETEAGRVIATSRNNLIHEDYDAFTLENDLSLIFLDSSISGPNIATIRLPSRSMSGETFEGQVARSSGWGYKMDGTFFLTEDLKFVDLSIISNAECFAVYDIITDCHLCIDTAGGTAGVCSGDSGGPLTITEADGALTQVGITSFVSSEGCETPKPHGYCRVTCYLDWIESNSNVNIRP